MPKNDTDVSIEHVAGVLGGTIVNESGTVVPVEGQRVERLLDDDTLRNAHTPDDVLAMLSAMGVTVERASDFELIKDKNELIAKPMILIQWSFIPSDTFGGEYVAVQAFVKGDNRKVVFTDGSTGIKEQLKQWTQKKLSEGLPPERAHAGIDANAGLRRSDYKASDGAAADGSTFYIQGLPAPRKV
jgi:hypothetical protein